MSVSLIEQAAGRVEQATEALHRKSAITRVRAEESEKLAREWIKQQRETA